MGGLLPFLLLLLGCPLRTSAEYPGNLLQLHVITRHGSRYPLVKDADTLREGTAGKLTTRGIKEHYQLGAYLNYTYGLDYVWNKVRFESSSFDRTMESALSLSDGMYGSSVHVPIYSIKNENDIFIRAYDKCPTFTEDLQKLYESDLWVDKEEDNIPILNRLANMPAFAQYSGKYKYIFLEDLWNIYDLVSVAKQCTPDCPKYLLDANETVLSEAEWTTIENLAHFAEIEKYKAGGNRLGANLLRRIASRIMTDDNGQVYLYSGHYPTILGVLNALGVIDIVGDVIPPFASAIVFEVYEENMMEYVKMKYKPGDSSEDLLEVSLCNGVCTLFDFEEYVSRNLPNTREWCDLCGNTEADVCMRFRQKELERNAKVCKSSSPEPVWMVAVGYVSALFCVGAVYYLVVRRRRPKAVGRQPPEAPKEMELTESSFT